MAWVESSCPSDCGKVWGNVGYYLRIFASPQTIPQSLGQLLLTQAITHFQSGLCVIFVLIKGDLRHLSLPSKHTFPREKPIYTVRNRSCSQIDLLHWNIISKKDCLFTFPRKSDQKLIYFYVIEILMITSFSNLLQNL